MRRMLIATLLALPSVSLAQQCQFSAPRALDLDLTGVRSLRFEVNAHNLHLQPSPGGTAALTGRACSSDAQHLKDLKVTQKRQGDRLIVELVEARPLGISLGNHQAYLDIQASVPAMLPIQLNVGSGDAWSNGNNLQSVDIGSGDVDIRNANGRVIAKVGSGDLKLQNVGELKLLGLGSGDAIVDTVRGPVTVASIGSGDLSITTVQGSVEIGSIGSGDVAVSGIKGNVAVDSIGAGDLEVRNVAGGLSLKRKGSGDVRYHDVRGTVAIPSQD